MGLLRRQESRIGWEDGRTGKSAESAKGGLGGKTENTLSFHLLSRDAALMGRG